ncbi:GntR family transcriptional regulator [Kribbella sp. NPDC056951]|uniref:GntR family transcriptional regulator n=1 Tax=Kribbella sp. NPDC056951 TaxID=3345978 RepID=UPI00363593E5
MTFPATLSGRGPKYLQIADQLRAEIQSGELSPGSRLPAETELADRFHVSPPTVRQALAVLRSEWLIESRHGVGTFVRENRKRQRRSRNRYGRARTDQRLLNDALEHRIVFAGRGPVPPHIAEAMGVEPGSEVVIRRRHLHDKTTSQLREIGASYVPLSHGAGTYLEEAAVVPKALFLCIEELSGKTYHHAQDTTVIRAAEGDEPGLFHLAGGEAILHLVHTARSADDEVLEISESIWPADQVVFIDEYDIPQHGETPTSRSEI